MLHVDKLKNFMEYNAENIIIKCKCDICEVTSNCETCTST